MKENNMMYIDVEYDDLREHTTIEVDGSEFAKNAFYCFIENKKCSDYVMQKGTWKGFFRELEIFVNKPCSIFFKASHDNCICIHEAFEHFKERFPNSFFEKLVCKESQIKDDVLEELDEIAHSFKDSSIDNFKGELVLKDYQRIRNSPIIVNVIGDGGNALIDALLADCKAPVMDEPPLQYAIKYVNDSCNANFSYRLLDEKGSLLRQYSQGNEEKLSSLMIEGTEYIEFHGSLPLSFNLKNLETQINVNRNFYCYKKLSKGDAFKDCPITLYILNESDLKQVMKSEVLDVLSTGTCIFILNVTKSLLSDSDRLASYQQCALDHLMQNGFKCPLLIPLSIHQARVIQLIKNKKVQHTDIKNEYNQIVQEQNLYCNHERLGLEDYGSLPLLDKLRIHQKLEIAIHEKHTDEQLLLHFGLRSLEILIANCIRKKKLKDRIENLSDELFKLLHFDETKFTEKFLTLQKQQLPLLESRTMISVEQSEQIMKLHHQVNALAMSYEIDNTALDDFVVHINREFNDLKVKNEEISIIKKDVAEKSLMDIVEEVNILQNTFSKGLKTIVEKQLLDDMRTFSASYEQYLHTYKSIVGNESIQKRIGILLENEKNAICDVECPLDNAVGFEIKDVCLIDMDYKQNEYYVIPKNVKETIISKAYTNIETYLNAVMIVRDELVSYTHHFYTIEFRHIVNAWAKTIEENEKNNKQYLQLREECDGIIHHLIWIKNTEHKIFNLLEALI